MRSVDGGSSPSIPVYHIRQYAQSYTPNNEAGEAIITGEVSSLLECLEVQDPLDDVNIHGELIR